MKLKFTFIALLFCMLAIHSQEKVKKEPSYLRMMYDTNINFYTVCDSAEAYFKTIDKDKKGSGYKPFLRWKYLNEEKYFPSGDRNIDPSLPYQTFLRVKKESEPTNSSPMYRNINAPQDEAAGWTSFGPDYMGTITGHYSAGLGRMEYVKVNPNNKNQIYLGSRSGGLWRTNDEGAHWVHHTDFLPASGVNSITTKPSDFNSVLFNVQSGDSKLSFGIYRSEDGGNTFSPTTFTPTNVGYGGVGSNFKIYEVKYHPSIANLVFIGTSQGLYISTDNLTTTNWTKKISGGDIYSINFHPTNSNVIYVYDGYYTENKNRILKSTDGGLNFTGMTDFAGNGNKKLKIFVTATCPDCVFVSSDNGIWKSTDAAETFATVQNPAPSGIELWQAIPNDLDPTKFVSGYVDMYRSTDSGANFSKCTWWSLGDSNNGTGSNQINYNNSTNYIHADDNYLDCVNGIFYSCSDGFLSKSEDNGQTWVKLSNGVGNRENYCLGVSQSNDAVTILGSQDNGASLKREEGWYELYGADGMECIVHPINDQFLIYSVQNGGRLRSFDNGYTVSDIRPAGTSGYWIAPMFYDPNRQMRIYTFADKVYRTDNFGTNWTQLGSPTTFSGNINEAAIAENNSNKIIIAQTNHLELSTDGGNTFNNIMGNLPYNLYISDVTFDPDNDNTILVTYPDVSSVYGQNKVFISTNSGNSWTNITYNLGYMPVHNVVVAKGIIYVATEIGVYYKTLTETSWTLLHNDLPNVTVKELEVNYGSNTLNAATWGRGLWKTKLIGKENYPTIVKTELTHPVNFETPKRQVDQYVTSKIDYEGTLTQVYVSWAVGTPNFNETNTISMSLLSGNLWKSNTPLPNDYPAGTQIYFKVTAVGSNADITETYKFNYELKPNEYCSAIGDNSYPLYINSIVCSNLNNVTNAYGSGGYTLYNTPKIILFKGDTYPVTGNFNQGWADNDFQVWIDYDKDFVFTSNEKVINDLNTGATGYGTFTIPLSSPTMETRMRIRLGYWSQSTNPCGSTLGEVEDYVIKIIDKPSITFDGNTSFCANEVVALNYTGSNVQTIQWELSNGINTYTYSGNSFNSNSLPEGNYTVKILYTIEDTEFSKIFSNYFTIKPAPSTVNISNQNQTVCYYKPIELNATGGFITGFNKTFSSNSINLNIPDNNLTTGVSTSLNITDFTSNDNITKVAVKINLTHTYLDDLTINLEAPNGKIINLFNQHGSSGHNLTNTIITSDTSAPAFTNVASAAPFTGTFRASLADQSSISTTPAVNSTLFSDLFSIANGEWKLRIYDDYAGDIGVLIDWSITLYHNSSEITWTPTSYLFSDEACQVPYNGEITSKVYARPESSISYTAKTQQGSCISSDEVSLTIDYNTYVSGSWSKGSRPNSSTETAIIEDNLTLTDDIHACSCIVKPNKTIDIPAGKTLIIDGAISNQGIIEIEHEGSLVQVNETDSNTEFGTNIVHKTTTTYRNYDYIYWSSPLNNETLGSVFAENPSGYKYTLNTADYLDMASGSYVSGTQVGGTSDGFDDNGNDWVPTSNSSVMSPGKGYIVLGKGSPIPFNSSAITSAQPSQSVVFDGGKFNNGTIPVEVKKDLYHINNLTGANNAHLNTNFIGNPYPSAIDIKALKNVNSLLTGTFYFWTHNIDVAANTGPNAYDFSNDSYATVTTNGTTVDYALGSNPASSISSYYIPSCQGFMANVSDEGTVYFKNSMRVTGNNTTFLRQNNLANNRLWLNLTDTENLFRQISIGFREEASDTYQLGEDAPRMLNGSNVDFYSLIPGNVDRLVIQNLSSFNIDKIVPLGIEIYTNTTYNIALANTEGIFTQGQAIYLEDTYLNVIHDLGAGAYSFTQTAGANINDRFVLRFTNATANNNELGLSNLIIFPNPSTDKFHFSLPNEERVQIEISDVTGKRLQNLTLNQENGSFTIDLSNESDGIYFAKITTSNGQVTKKLIVE